MDRIGITWIFETKDMLNELTGLFARVYQAESNGYSVIKIECDDTYSWSNPGFTKMIIVCEKNREHNFSYSI